MSELARWTTKGLSECLGFDAPADMTRYILAIETKADLEAYLNELLDSSISVHRHFMMDLLKRRIFVSAPVGVAYKKPTLQDERPATHKPAVTASKSKRRQQVKVEAGERPARGREECECQAVKHALVSNCLGCGRVVCSREGAGPCLFCNTIVYTAEQESALTGEEARQRQDLVRGDVLAEHLERRDRLLDYDKTVAQRTKVLDDEADYFSTGGNRWLSAVQRARLEEVQESLQEQKHGGRTTRPLIYDFAGRQLVTEDTSLVDERAAAEAVHEELRAEDNSMWRPLAEKFPGGAPDLQFILTARTDEGVVRSQWDKGGALSRVQDEGLATISDDGLCLSMHQPYAGLLIAGLKLDEGRTWYSAHRGRLWIAAAGKLPLPDEIAVLEEEVRVRQPDALFPTTYPTSCLLGCVDVIDVLDQDEYRKQYPDGCSGSPFVFVCREPRELPLKLSVKGQHKIWKLDGPLHKAVRKALGV